MATLLAVAFLGAAFTACSPAQAMEDTAAPSATASVPQAQSTEDAEEVDPEDKASHVHTYFLIGMDRKPSCVQSGSYVSLCMSCGELRYEAVPALQHRYALISETEAGCETEGEQVYQCTLCGDSYTVYTQALEHDYQQADTWAADCVSDGGSTYTCARCGGTYTETVSALGHDYEKTASVAATCESAGSVTYTCARCGKTYTETVSALGHDWKAATTSAPKTCRRCGAESGSPLASNPDGVTAEDIIATAMEYLGVPYVWGGTTPSGFDCSGFVQYVFNLHGITLPRTSKEQYCVGTAVSRSELEPGDLVFFETGSNGVSHLGIYIGDDQFINATQSRGIAISYLSNSYWDSRYYGARRIL